MKKIITLYSMLMVFSCCIPAFGQQHKQSFFGSLFSKKKNKEYFKTDSLKSVAVQPRQSGVDFRKASEDENVIMIPQYVYDDFVKNGSSHYYYYVQVPHFVIYDLGWGTIVFNGFKLYPDFFSH